ncbi:MAG: molybdopterin molybdotransferase MoeA [Deltaproteobacteria bacterium]|nr:molybdopterin molybdotransferase MoeA [Deltaproteobacteria bacterium]
MTAASKAKEILTPVEEARAHILAACAPLTVFERAMCTSLALEPRPRRLATRLVSRRALPPYANSAMDGYGVRAVDVAAASDEHPVSLRLVGQSLAGGAATTGIGPGEAVAITTGAAIPAGVDAVVMRERCDEQAVPQGVVGVRHAAPAGEHIRPRGEDIDEGTVVGEPGDVVTPARLNLWLSAGHIGVDVLRRPRVSILASGDELREVGDGSGDDVIVNSNAWAVAAAAVAAGADVRLLGIARDTLADHVHMLDVDGADVLVTIGGVSVGSHDFMRPALEALGAELSLWKIAMRPGKPLAFGKLPCRRRPTLVFGLPGNPVSTMVAFALFVAPALRALQGEVDVAPKTTPLPLFDEQPFVKKAGLAFFARARLAQRDGVTGLVTLDRQGSGQVSGLAAATHLACLPAAATTVAPGTLVDALAL